MKNKVEILGVGVDPLTFEELKDWTKEHILAPGVSQVSKAPAEFFVRAAKDKVFRKVLEGSDLVIPDGVGVLWAAKYNSLPLRWHYLRGLEAWLQVFVTGFSLLTHRSSFGRAIIPERLSGVEAFQTMLSGCLEAKESVFLFGSREDILKKTVEKLTSDYPSLNIAGTHDGYSDKGNKVLEAINKSGASLLIVALGSPEQEYWIRDNLSKLKNIRVAVGEGGTFDYVAGVNRRAPIFIQKIGLEWLWRSATARNLTTGAGHRLKRIWTAVPVFISLVVQHKIECSRDTFFK